MDALISALRAAAEPSRLRLLALCAQADLSVTELTQILGQSQPSVSRHLKLLCDAGLLNRSREGLWAFYRLANGGNGGRMGELAQWLVDLIPNDDPGKARDLARLNQATRERSTLAQDYFRANAAEWDEIRRLYVDEAAVEARLLQLVPGPVQEHLDLGTGTGRILELFGERCSHGLGIDLSPEMLAIARDKLGRSPNARNLSVRQGDISNLALKEHTFDLVTLHQVLHYSDDPRTVIREAGRMLAKGGQLIVVDFAPHQLEFLRQQHAHRRLGFSDAELSSWFKEAGLNLQTPVALTGDPLTVMIWPAAAEVAA